MKTQPMPELICSLRPTKVIDITGLDESLEELRREARKPTPNRKTAGEWAEEKGCGKDLILRWLKRGIKQGEVTQLWAERWRADERLGPVPVYQINRDYIPTSPFARHPAMASSAKLDAEIEKANRLEAKLKRIEGLLRRVQSAWEKLPSDEQLAGLFDRIGERMAALESIVERLSKLDSIANPGTLVEKLKSARSGRRTRDKRVTVF